ncbi:hypothetical protein JZ751_004882 [Albula glossodonta]|uniref:Syndecan n=1 Tax=Albula glossodonta TaxID=121402 RepID=A0A8T2P422_9TELE|nr:hypothetical protein JZ751_004882 [Albula glossodonta]
MKMQSIVFLILFLGWCSPGTSSEALGIPEDQDGSGADLEHSGSEEWSAFFPPNRTNPENCHSQNISASPTIVEKFTQPPTVETTSHNVSTQSLRPLTTTIAVVDVRPEILNKKMTPPPSTILHSSPSVHPAETSDPDSFEEDAESGDGTVEMSTSSPLTTEKRTDSVFNIIDVEDKIFPNSRANDEENEMHDDSDLTFDVKPETTDSTVGSLAKSQGILEKKEVLAGKAYSYSVIAGGVVGLLLAVAMVSFVVYRMKKKDEGSYALDAQQNSYRGYQKAQTQEEFLA